MFIIIYALVIIICKHTNITWGYKGRNHGCSGSVTHEYVYSFVLMGNVGIGQAYRKDLQRNENEINWLYGDVNISLAQGGGCKDGQNNSAEHLAAVGINSVYLAD
jgi:hypothetical protein